MAAPFDLWCQFFLWFVLLQSQLWTSAETQSSPPLTNYSSNGTVTTNYTSPSDPIRDIVGYSTFAFIIIILIFAAGILHRCRQTGKTRHRIQTDFLEMHSPKRENIAVEGDRISQAPDSTNSILDGHETTVNNLQLSTHSGRSSTLISAAGFLPQNETSSSPAQGTSIDIDLNSYPADEYMSSNKDMYSNRHTLAIPNVEDCNFDLATQKKPMRQVSKKLKYLYENVSSSKGIVTDDTDFNDKTRSALGIDNSYSHQRHSTNEFDAQIDDTSEVPFIIHNDLYAHTDYSPKSIDRQGQSNSVTGSNVHQEQSTRVSGFKELPTPGSGSNASQDKRVTFSKAAPAENNRVTSSNKSVDQNRRVARTSAPQGQDLRETSSKLTTDQIKMRRNYENVLLNDSAAMSDSSDSHAESKYVSDYFECLPDDDEVNYKIDNIYFNYTPLSPTAPWNSLQRSLLESLASGQLSNQFKELQRGTKQQCEEGFKPENTRKNRFKTLSPYDHNRIILHRPNFDKETDYINASYIKGFQKEKAYIAAQGPRNNTVGDMWWMIWQEEIEVIVMLTNLKEDTKNKCAQYWPEPNTSRTYDNFVVTNREERVKADFIVRNFDIVARDTPAYRQITQYHYIAWPDHHVPNAPSLVDFWRFIKSRANPNVPLLVHCSAGVGRTGSFIALDIAMDQAEHGHEVVIKNIVQGLREDRLLMVQTLAQYTFLFEVILEAYTSRQSRMTLDQFNSRFHRAIKVHESNSTIDDEYKVLQRMTSFLHLPSNSISRRQENISKNRSMDSLPDDRHVASLSTCNSCGGNTYINAVCLSSFRHKNGYLLTQLPLSNTIGDFWCLTFEKEVNTIISVESNNDSFVKTANCQYWPKKRQQTLAFGQFSVTLQHVIRHNVHLLTYFLTVEKDTQKRDIKLLHYMGFTEDGPHETSGFIQLADTLESCRTPEDKSPLLVQCIDGESYSAIVCLLLDVISRAEDDHEVDIFLTSRHVQLVRPHAVKNEQQYRYCYKVVQDYIPRFSIYNNV